MAEVTGLRNNALPYPVYGAPWGVAFPMLDADGDLVTGATTPDAEVSKNGDTFADCTNESVEIATASGVYYLLLTAAEMTADVVVVIAKSATAGMKTTTLTFYPRKLVALRAATAAGGAAGSITLDASASAVDDAYNGCLVVGVLDSTTEARIITDYTGSSKVAAVTPNWNVTPDSDDTFTIYLPEGIQLNQANASHWNSLATVELPLVPTTAGRKLDVSAGGEAGVDWANIGSPTTAQNLSGTNIDVDQVVASVSGAVASVTGLTAATVHSDLDDIQARLPAALTANGNIKADTLRIAGTVQTAGDVAADTAAILVDTAVIGAAGAGLTAVPWNAAWDAEVESEVNDAIDTVIAELGVAAPTATPTLRTGMMLMYMALRNKLVVQTSGTDAIEIYNNAGTKIASKAITDDGADYTEAEMA